MTNNEKRAHDLAIAAVPIIYNGVVNQAYSNNSDGKQNIIFDAYAEYIKAYNSSLECFNRDFPDER